LTGRARNGSSTTPERGNGDERSEERREITDDEHREERRKGGTYRYTWRSADGKGTEFGMHGIYREVVAPERIVTTEYFGEGEALCTLVLTERGGVTTLSHTMLFSSREERDGALQSGMTKGVEQSYGRLAERLSASA
jgi:uncharacterized protein YndB with AHSA1/START domain